MPYRLLSVGPVSELLTTRNAVLRQAGFLVETSFDLNEALALFLAEDFDVAVVCHSVPARDKERFVRLLKEHKPLTPVAVMSDGHHAGCGDEEIHNLDGPEELLQRISELIASAQRCHGRIS